MNILITAGGTSEKIDAVRTISNIATGRLGCLIAEAFLRVDATVIYVCSTEAAVPQDPSVTVIRINNVQSLEHTLENLLSMQAIDAIIHTMAVSDFSVKYSASSDELARFLAESLLQNKSALESRKELSDYIQSQLSEYATEQNVSKISSEIERLFICLEKTPKVIRLFKKLQPDAVLVGFKLLADADESDLLSAAKRLMESNACDYVLANDIRNIDENRHVGILVGADQSKSRFTTKQEISDAITSCVIKKIKRKNRT